MVVDEPKPKEEAVSLLFHALADPTRRDIVRRALDGEDSVSALARHYPISLAAVQKHVVVLERAKLISKQRRGREQIVRADPQALERAHRALDQLERTWRGRVGRIDQILNQTNDGER